jgi:hypothetical protein
MTGRAAAVLSLAALAAACRRTPAPGDPPGPARASETAAPGVEASAAPADHLAPGELVEGPGQAFGIALPRGMLVSGAFVDVVYASAPASVHALARYFGARLESGGVREGEQAATFEHVRVRGKPGDELTVKIARAPQGARVEIRKATPPPAVVPPDEASRWKQVGLTPEGRLADPNHLD